MMKSALVVEGGAMRGIFAAGVLDTFMQQHYSPFDFVLGVSAGATNLSTYVAGAHKLGKKIITQYATRREFFSPLRFIKGGHMTDVHWLWHQCKQSLPLHTIDSQPQLPLYVGVTNAQTGKCEYLRATSENIDQLMVASCAIPVAYREQPVINGTKYVDGGVADPIPVKQAYEMGARDITVVLSQAAGYTKPVAKGGWLFQKLYAEQPKLLEALLNRPQIYNDALQFMDNPPADCKVTVLAPSEHFKVRRLTMDKMKLTLGYREGKKAAGAHLRGIKENEPFTAAQVSGGV